MILLTASHIDRHKIKSGPIMSDTTKHIDNNSKTHGRVRRSSCEDQNTERLMLLVLHGDDDVDDGSNAHGRARSW